MNEHEGLIEEAAKAMANAPHAAGWEAHSDDERDWYRKDATIALSVFEKAQTPTDDERMARLMSYVTPLGYASALALIEAETRMLTEAKTSSALSELLDEPSEPQCEPSDEAEDLIRAIADELTPGRRDKDLVIAARELRLAAEKVEPSEAQVTAAAREYHERGNGEGSFDRMSDHLRTSLLFRMGCALRAAGGAQ